MDILNFCFSTIGSPIQYFKTSANTSFSKFEFKSGKDGKICKCYVFNATNIIITRNTLFKKDRSVSYPGTTMAYR